MCFSQVQDCWRWLSLIRLSSSAKKETQTKIGSSSVAVRDLLCSRRIWARLSRTVPHLLIGNWFHINYAGDEACFPEAFYKCSNNLFAWSQILKNGLLCGGVRWKWLMAALKDFAICAIVLPRGRVKKTSNKHSVLPLTFLISVLKFGGTWTSKPFC